MRVSGDGRRLAGWPLWIGLWLSLAAGGVTQAETRATVLWYMEQEAGNDPWEVRYIVTDRYLRSDQGDDSVDFVLLDRRAKQIYNVVEDTRTILNIDGRGTPEQTPGALEIEVRRSHDREAPRLEGKASTTLELRAGGKTCYSSVVVEGLLDDARQAFQEFADVLAIQQQRSKGNTPAEYVTPCFQARYLYAGDFDVRVGVPVVTWSPDGAHRQLLRYERDVPVDDALFELPADYETYQPLAPAPADGAP